MTAILRGISFSDTAICEISHIDSYSKLDADTEDRFIAENSDAVQTRDRYLEILNAQTGEDSEDG